MPHDPHRLARRLVDDDTTDRAARRALRALAAWAALPDFARRAYRQEAQRMARRAADAVLELVDVGQEAAARAPEKSAARSSADRRRLLD